MASKFSLRTWVLSIGLLVVFGSSASVGKRAEAGIAGLWEFGNASNVGQATIGNNLTVVGTTPSHFASQTYNGLTLNGVIETVPGIANHLIATHGIAANGGGTRVNQYSMLFDIRRPNTDEWRTLFQSDTTNANDGDYFIRNSDARLGVGALGYTTNFQMPADQWHRLVITADLSATGAYQTYIDGTLIQTHTQPALDSDRFSFLPTVLLFGDEDVENNLLSVGAVAIWDQTLNSAQVASLGLAGTSIVAVPEPSSMMLVGLVAVGLYAARRRKKA